MQCSVSRWGDISITWTSLLLRVPRTFGVNHLLGKLRLKDNPSRASAFLMHPKARLHAILATYFPALKVAFYEGFVCCPPKISSHLTPPVPVPVDCLKLSSVEPDASTTHNVTANPVRLQTVMLVAIEVCNSVQDV